MVRIWNRDVELQYTSDVREGLESSLSWKPSGEVIAVSQQRFQKHEISLMEKNGLLLYSFKLPFAASSFVMKDISWSTDSSVLAVRGCLHREQEYLMLWSVSNHHWYLKQTFEWKEGQLSSFVWDPVDPLVMHFLFANGSYWRCRWIWDVCRSRDASVAVIDGNEVLVTPFSRACVPPPMSGQSLSPSLFLLKSESPFPQHGKSLFLTM